MDKSKEKEKDANAKERQGSNGGGNGGGGLFGGQIGTRYGAGWRTYFGSSNVRGGGEDEAIEDDEEKVSVKPEVLENGDGKPKRKPRRTTRKIKEEADEDGPLSAKKRKGEHGVDFMLKSV